MNKTWMLSILIASLALLCLLKSHEQVTLTPFFKSEKSLKLTAFQNARAKVAPIDLELLKLWESILTGRSAPLSKLLKERYRSLGLNHIFTPSGFHLTAVLLPFMKLFKSSSHIYLLLVLSLLLFFLPGLSALKRMLLIKSHQKILGMHLGFIVALAADALFGSFQEGATSFTYSFLFLGIIYSGAEGLGLLLWFFAGQILLAYFQGSDVSLLIIFFSPLLNLGFTLLMPVLFCLSFPLWDWQLHLGIFFLKGLQHVVVLSSEICRYFPVIEINIFVIFLIGFFLFRKRVYLLAGVLFFCSSLNYDRQRQPGAPMNEFVPQEKHLRTTYSEKHVMVYFVDGSCKLRLVRGFWYESCSPKRGSRNKGLKKLSYPS